MKRALFDTVTVLPFASGNVVDRTGYESGNVDDVMDGNLDGFITAYLKMQ